MLNFDGIVTLLFLLLVANGTPIILKRVLGDLAAAPIDGGLRGGDGRPFFGRAKTWRGLVGAVLTTALVASAVGLDLATGAAVGAAAHAGDLFSSYVKRRLGVPASGQAVGLDHLPEAIFPALVVQPAFGLSLLDVVFVGVAFLVGGLVISRALHRLRIRDEPY